MWFYVLMWTSLWTMGVILIFKNITDFFSRWIGILMVAGGFGSFCLSLPMTIVPFLLETVGLSPFTLEMLHGLAIASAVVYWFIAPYFYFISSFYFSRIRVRISWHALFLIPLILYATYHFAYSSPAEFTTSQFNAGTGLYTLAGTVIFIVGYVRERNSIVKPYKLRSIVVLLTAFVWAYVSDHLSVSRIRLGLDHAVIEHGELWNYNYLIILWLVVFFIFFGFRYGFLGVKLKIERRHYETRKTLSKGASMLYRALQKEVRGIRGLSSLAKERLNIGDTDTAIVALRDAMAINAQLRAIIDKIKEQSDDVTVREAPCRISELLDGVMAEIGHLSKVNGAVIDRSIVYDAELFVDPLLIRKAIAGVLCNAIEATAGSHGTISVRTDRRKNNFVLEVQDNGQGISKENLAAVFEPFFTTKESSTHYGLGLGYSFNVMRKHGGAVKITESNIGKGTTVAFIVPEKRVLAWNKVG